MNGGIPENSVKVRELEKEGVDDLVNSFTEHGIKLPMEIIGVIWVDPNSKLLDLNNLQVDLSKPNSRYHILMLFVACTEPLHSKIAIKCSLKSPCT